MRALRHKYVHYEGFDFLRKNIFYLFLGLLCRDDILYDIQEAYKGEIQCTVLLLNQS